MTEPGGGKERRRGGNRRKSPCDIHLITIFRRKEGMNRLWGEGGRRDDSVSCEGEGMIALVEGYLSQVRFVSNWDVETENLAEVEEDISQ
jgi:hypothetical protein